MPASCECSLCVALLRKGEFYNSSVKTKSDLTAARIDLTSAITFYAQMTGFKETLAVCYYYAHISDVFNIFRIRVLVFFKSYENLEKYSRSLSSSTMELRSG